MKKIILIVVIIALAYAIYSALNKPPFNPSSELGLPPIPTPENQESLGQDEKDESLPENQPGDEIDEEPFTAPGFEGLPIPGGSGQPTGEVEVFSGTLEEVNTGCFADGECYVVVDGKKVTLIIGWQQETVGYIHGADGVGGLEEHIGTEVEVYAMKQDNGTYTLYGSEQYYVEVKGRGDEATLVQ